jgi:hypothetical protein
LQFCSSSSQHQHTLHLDVTTIASLVLQLTEHKQSHNSSEKKSKKTLHDVAVHTLLGCKYMQLTAALDATSSFSLPPCRLMDKAWSSMAPVRGKSASDITSDSETQ